ncbi:MAG: transglutaminase domain-containing protein [Clostridia bacterium]|nr:transglutaminase domain-containing protein [Clostridia bacterium]
MEKTKKRDDSKIYFDENPDLFGLINGRSDAGYVLDESKKEALIDKYEKDGAISNDELVRYGIYVIKNDSDVKNLEKYPNIKMCYILGNVNFRGITPLSDVKEVQFCDSIANFNKFDWDGFGKAFHNIELLEFDGNLSNYDLRAQKEVAEFIEKYGDSTWSEEFKKYLLVVKWQQLNLGNSVLDLSKLPVLPNLSNLAFNIWATTKNLNLNNFPKLRVLVLPYDLVTRFDNIVGLDNFLQKNKRFIANDVSFSSNDAIYSLFKGDCRIGAVSFLKLFYNLPEEEREELRRRVFNTKKRIDDPSIIMESSDNGDISVKQLLKATLGIELKAKELWNPKSSDIENIATIYTYLKTHLTYEYEEMQDRDFINTFKEGKGICLEMSRLFEIMCNINGINMETQMCHLIGPNSLEAPWGNHAINKLHFVDPKTGKEGVYYFDLTSDCFEKNTTLKAFMLNAPELMGSKVRAENYGIILLNNKMKYYNFIIQKLSDRGKLKSKAGETAISRNNVFSKISSILKHQFIILPQLEGFDTPSMQAELNKAGILDLPKKNIMDDSSKSTNIVR